jgi:hypothetical protein
MPHYVWETPNWPNFCWNSEALLKPLAVLREQFKKKLAERLEEPRIPSAVS